MVPGLPMPTAARSVVEALAAVIEALTVFAIAATTASAPVVGVRARELPTILRWRRMTVWILVPPRATPAVSRGLAQRGVGPRRGGVRKVCVGPTAPTAR